MKNFILIAAGVALATAQTLDDIPECGRGCVTRVLAKAQSLGCKADDASCLCGNANFGYGLRDCSNQACGSTVAQQVVAYGVAYCQKALGSSSSMSSSGAMSATGSGASMGSDTATATKTGEEGSRSAVTTSALTALVSQSDTTFTTTTGSTTIYAGGATGSAASAASSAISSASKAGESAASSASAAVSSVASSASTRLQGAASSATGSSTAGGAMVTAGPMLAMGALAALAAM